MEGCCRFKRGTRSGEEIRRLGDSEERVGLKEFL